MWTDDPVKDAEAYDRQLERNAERHCIGRCAHCGEPVHDWDDHYDFDGVLVHDDCLYGWAENYRKKAI